MSTPPRDLIEALSMPISVRVLEQLERINDKGAATDALTIAATSGILAAVVRSTLINAVHAQFVDLHLNPVPAPVTYRITTAGIAHLRRLDRTAIDVNEAVIDVNDQSSSTSKTGPRGRPAWCTPGEGVCTPCKELP